jgi:hypothetical protein
MRVVVFNAMLSSWKGDAEVVGASSKQDRRRHLFLYYSLINTQLPSLQIRAREVDILAD